MLYLILALTFGAMGLSFYEYFKPDTSTNTIIPLSFDILWLPLLGFWLIAFWNATLKPNPTFSRLRLFLITPVLATLTLGITQLNWGLSAGLWISQNEMLAKARTSKNDYGNGRIGLFQFSEFRRIGDESVFVLTKPNEGAHTGFFHAAKPMTEAEILKKMATGPIDESHVVLMGNNWSYWRFKYKYAHYF